MGKSFLERLARGLGKSTGKLVEKAKEHGLDKKAGELVEKAQGKLKDLKREYDQGQDEAKVEREEESAESEEHEADGERPGSPENGVAADHSEERRVEDPGDAPGEDRDDVREA